MTKRFGTACGSPLDTEQVLTLRQQGTCEDPFCHSLETPVLTLAIGSGGDSIPGLEAAMFSSSGDPDALFASLSFPSHWGHSQAVCPELELEPEISAT